MHCFACLRSACLALLFIAPFSLAQSPADYSALIDADNDSTTGCSVVVPGTGQTLTGIEYRLTASVDGALQVTDLALRACTGNAFGPAQDVGGGYPVGLDNGVAGSDVIEMGVDLLAIDLIEGGEIALAFSATDGTDGDVMTQAPGGGPVVFGIEGIPALPVSTLGIGGLLLLAGILLIAGIFAARHSRLMTLSILGLLLMPLAWAAAFMLDGQVGDWSGEAQVASDADGDASDGGNGLDLIAAFAGEESGRLYLRIDIADLQNEAPVAVADTETLDEDTSLSVAAPGVLGNDSDADGDPLSAVLETAPTNAAAFSLDADGSFDYTPAADFNGTDSFSYRASDGGSQSAPATVTLTVAAVNDAPVADATSAGTDEDTTVTVTLTGSDVDGDTLSFAVATPPASGSLGAITPIDATTAEVTYTPNADFNGSDSFAFTVDDGTDTSAPASVTLTVAAVNDAPVAEAGSASTDEDTAVTITLTGSDIDGDALNFAIATPPASGSLGAITPVDATTSEVTYTPDANFNGSDSFTFTVDDGSETSAPATISLSIGAVNDPPVADPASASTDEDTPVTITLTGNDLDGDPLSFAIAAAPASGSLGAITPIDASTAEVTYTPDADFNGSDGFSFTADDGGLSSPPALVEISVTPVNDPPVLTFPTPGVNFDPNAGAVNLDPAATLADIDSPAFNRVSVNLDIAGSCDPLDVVTVENQGSAPGQIGFDGSTVSYEGTPISTAVQPWVCLNPGDGSQDAFIVELDSGSADQAAVQALVRALQFDSLSTDDSLREAEVVVADQADATDSALQVINIDQAPEISSPVNGDDNVDPAGNLAVDFSEPVDIASSAFALECGGAVGFTTTPVLPATGINSIDLTPTSNLTPGAACTLTAFAPSISDSDTIDPPDNPVADAAFLFIVEAPPQVAGLVPGDGSANVDPAGNVVIDFDEPVDLAGDWFSLACGATTWSPSAGNIAISSNGPGNMQVTLDPDTDFGFGEACSLEVFAGSTDGVSDQDTVDGPGLDTLDGNGDGVGGDSFLATFDIEAAPEVVATSPADNTVGTAADLDIVVEFSEPVSAGAGAFTLECPAAIGLGVTANGSQDTYTLTPASELPAGATCQVTVAAALISDLDTIDPPDNLDGNGDGTPGDDYVFEFTVDEAPTLQSVEVEVGDVFTTVPGAFGGAGGVTNADADTSLRTTFSEPVNDNGGTTVACATSGTISSGGAGLTVAGNGSNQLVLTRTSGTFTAGETCAISFNEAGLTDVDAADPPDALETPTPAVYEFEVAPQAQDDAFTVSAHLEARYDTVAPGTTNLLSNDLPAGASVIEVNGSAAGVGTQIALPSEAYLTVEADGDFNYVPPPGVGGGATDSFTYTLETANGVTATASVQMTIDGPVIWYVDADATGPIYNGTAAFPFDTLGDGSGGGGNVFNPPAAGAGATVFVYDAFSDNSPMECGLELLDDQTIIGEGEMAGMLDALTGRSPVPETVFAPDTTGAPPQLFAAGFTCLLVQSDNTIRGLDIGDTPGAGAINGNAIGTLIISDVGVRGSGSVLSLTDGTLNAELNEASSIDSNTEIIRLDNISGILNSAAGSISGNPAGSSVIRVSGGNVSGALSIGVTKSNDGALLDISNGHAGNLNFLGPMNASAGDGLRFDNADGNYTLFAPLQITGGTAGIEVLGGSDGTLNILSPGSVIRGIQGVPFRVNNSAMSIDYDGNITHEQFTGSLVSARAVEIIGGTGTISLDGLVDVGSSIDRATGEAVFLSNTGLANPITLNYVDGFMRNVPVFVSQVSGNVAVNRLRVDCDGDLTVSGDTHCVQVSDTTSSGFTIEAMTARLGDAGDNGGALSLVNTPGIWTVEDISGRLAGRFQTTLFGSNFGTLNIATVDSPTSPGGIATGLVVNDEFGAIDLENGTMNLRVGNLQSFNALSSGLRLVNVDGPGLEVLDGEIPSTPDNAVVLVDTGNVTLNSLDIIGSAANGIFGQNVTNFTLTDSVVRANGGAVNEGGLRFENLLGSATIANSTIDQSAEHNIVIVNDTGALSSLDISDSTIGSNSAALGADGLLLEASSDAVVDIQVTNTSFVDNRSDGIQVNALDSSAVSIDVANSDFSSALDASPAGSIGARGLVLAAGSNASLDFDVGGNGANSFTNFSPNLGEEAINVTLLSTSTPTAMMAGSIDNNGFTNSGGAVGIDGRGNGNMVVRIDGNTADTSRQAIDIITGDGASDTAALDLTITNNALTVNGTAGNPDNEAVGFLADFDTDTCFNVRDNSGTASGTRADIILDDFTTGGGAVTLESGATDCGGGCASAQAHLQAANTIISAVASASINLVAPGSCSTP